jgi:hypothetical protein
MLFRKQIIFIISHENWGKMLMSKHHYAIELGKLGNKVFFINHPDKQYRLSRGQIVVESTDYNNIAVVEHRLFHPYFFKYRFKKIYNFLVSFHVKKIIKRVGAYPDVVWSFDPGNTLPLKYFPKSMLRIFMPVDGPFGDEDEIRASDKADLIISVTPEILSTFKHLDTPRLQINHGVADVFIHKVNKRSANETIRAGYSGSLLRNDLDTKTLIGIIAAHPDISFEFWGENDYKKSTIHLPQDVGLEARSFIATLHTLPNVILHGPVSSSELASGIQHTDILLICYKIKDAQNSHKMLEYLGTGKVVVSTFLSAYTNNCRELIEMTGNKDNNDEYPKLFSKVINGLDYYNSLEKQKMRIEFAQNYSYSNNIKLIENFIGNSQ